MIARYYNIPHGDNFTVHLETPKRLWLPLLILKNTGKLTSKTKFQKIAFLSQYESKIDHYDFKKHHYGPYSDSFALDTSCYSDLITETIHPSHYSGGYYYTYSLTEKGLKQLSEFEKQMDPELIKKVTEKINKFKEFTTCQLLEDVYSKFALKQNDSMTLEDEVNQDLLQVKSPIANCYENFHTRQPTFVLAILDTIEKIFSKVEKQQDTVQRGVIFNISKEIIHKCKEIGKDISPPTNSNFLRPTFLELHEQIQFLIEYCDTRKILNDPYSQPLEEVITEDDAERLAKELSEVTIPV